MSAVLQFDVDQAKTLQKTIKNKDKDMRMTLSRIKGLVERTVADNWTGLSADGFRSLYAESSSKISEYLKSWLECSSQLIADASSEKVRMENEEKAILLKAKEDMKKKISA